MIVVAEHDEQLQLVSFALFFFGHVKSTHDTILCALLPLGARLDHIMTLPFLYLGHSQV